jgi:methyl-accepting chemotaxis protein
MNLKHRILIIAFIPLLITLLFVVQLSSILIRDKSDLTQIAGNLTLMRANLHLATAVQKERGLSASATVDGSLMGQVEAQRETTNTTITDFLKALETAQVASKYTAPVKDLKTRIESCRRQVQPSQTTEVLRIYTALTEDLLLVNAGIIRAKTSFGYGKQMTAIAILQRGQESCGLLRGTMSSLINLAKPIQEGQREHLMNLLASVVGSLRSPGLVMDEQTLKTIDNLMNSPAFHQLEKDFQSVMDDAQATSGALNGRMVFVNATTVVDAIQQLCSGIVTELHAKSQKDLSRVGSEVVWKISLFSLLIVGMLGFTLFSIYTLQGHLKRAFASIKDSANAAYKMAERMEQEGTLLSERAVKSAASLEETSASMEELSSMVGQNSDGARKAREFSSRTSQSTREGVSSMTQMSQAMTEIKASSDSISRIIGTIDEIAFQTNILALNAAVEAARAGEAGAGFAVVAEEVRNLAQRSARAARETATLIETSVGKSHAGEKLSAQVSEQLEAIAQSIQAVDTLIQEIASGSEEQKTGIHQVNQAISELDSSTQENAATSENNASLAREMREQSEMLIEAVRDMQRLMGISL